MQIRGLKLPPPIREHTFHPIRKWRFDFAWPARLIAVEVEGGTMMLGRHTRGQGFEIDCEKYGEAMRYGWSVYRCTPALINRGIAIQTIETLLHQATDCVHISPSRGDYQGLYIKVIDGTPPAEVNAWAGYLHDQGYCARICPSWEHARDLIMCYLSR